LVASLMQMTVERFGHLDVLVANAEHNDAETERTARFRLPGWCPLAARRGGCRRGRRQHASSSGGVPIPPVAGRSPGQAVGPPWPHRRRRTGPSGSRPPRLRLAARLECFNDLQGQGPASRAGSPCQSLQSLPLPRSCPC
jgi:hypothetical protein